MPWRVVFQAHCCDHAATDFWPEGKMCETCIGLLKETMMVKMLLDTGYNVLAVSSSNRVSKCWDRIDDRKRIAIAIKWLDPELWKMVEHTTVAESQNSQVIRIQSLVVRLDAGAGAGAGAGPQQQKQQQHQQQQQKLRQLQQKNLYEKSMLEESTLSVVWNLGPSNLPSLPLGHPLEAPSFSVYVSSLVCKSLRRCAQYYYEAGQRETNLKVLRTIS